MTHPPIYDTGSYWYVDGRLRTYPVGDEPHEVDPMEALAMIDQARAKELVLK